MIFKYVDKLINKSNNIPKQRYYYQSIVMTSIDSDKIEYIHNINLFPKTFNVDLVEWYVLFYWKAHYLEIGSFIVNYIVYPLRVSD